MNLTSSLGIVIVWFFGGRRVLAGEVTVGELVAFVQYQMIMYRPLQWFAQLNNWLTRALAGAERIFEVIDADPEPYQSSDYQALPDIRGEVEFRGVTFGYERYKPVLKGVNLHVQPGEMIGLVGRSGAGKSTLINLLCRFYDPDEGQILVDGIDQREIRLESLRSRIGMVLQEPFLFNGTIAENIAYGKPDASLDEIIRAARAANAHTFVVNKPDGYDTQVGERGAKLSVGERQRVSIARAILHDPRILIMDEATASVDTETERQIQEAIGRLVQGRTTFAIAHRLSTLRNANRLVVIDEGTIAEVGTHDELMERKGLYHRLVNMQTEVNKLRAVDG
jgi:ATP-binding cassette subfamily B protein